MNGKVKFFDATKGFGFIVSDDGTEYYFNEQGIAQGVTVRDDDAVEFETEQGDRGPRAANVTLASKESAE